MREAFTVWTPLPSTPFTIRYAFISHIRAGKTYTYHCDRGSMTGLFVNNIIPGKRKTFTLCEVEVYAAPAGTTVTDWI